MIPEKETISETAKYNIGVPERVCRFSGKGRLSSRDLEVIDVKILFNDCRKTSYFRMKNTED